MSTIKTIKKLFAALKEYRALIILVFALSLCFAALSLVTPVLVGRAIDEASIFNKTDYKAVVAALLLLAVLLLLSTLFQWLTAVLTNKICQKTVLELRNKIFKKFNRLPLEYLDNASRGDLISRAVNDVDVIADGLTQGIIHLFSDILLIFGTLGVLLYINWLIALVVAFLTPLSILISNFIAKRNQKMFSKQAQIFGTLSGYCEEYVGASKIVKAYGFEASALGGFKNINAELQTTGVEAQFYSALINPAVRIVNNIIFACVGVAGGMLALNGFLSVGGLYAALSYASQYSKPFNEISTIITQLQMAVAAAERVFLVLEVPEAERTEGKKTLDGCRGDVVFSDVGFSYDKAKPLIGGFNLDVKSGQKVAIVGPTGSGKTTLINLLMGFYKIDGGSITIDNTNIYDLTASDLRKNFGMVLQDSWIFTATVAENIAYCDDTAAREQIVAAAKAAYAHDFIVKLPSGYDTVLSEENISISLGQKQQLNIARVMLKNARILVLDEATSNIDTRTEAKIQKALLTLSKGRTSFVVAHRLCTIKESDIVLVLRDGNIVERGTHDELIKKGGYYKELYGKQFETKTD
jgi:ABC-type multidrug transport system fused ATPase/permease subunit